VELVVQNKQKAKPKSQKRKPRRALSASGQRSELVRTAAGVTNLGVVSEIAKRIALPFNYDAMRFGTGAAGERTCVQRLFNRIDGLATTTDYQPGGGLAPGNSFAVVRKSFVNAIYPVGVTSTGGVYAYVRLGTQPTLYGGQRFDLQTSYLDVESASGDGWPNIGVNQYGMTINGIRSQRRYLYLSFGMKINVTAEIVITGTDGTAGATLSVHKFDGLQEFIDVGSASVEHYTTTDYITLSYTVPSNGYYSFSLSFAAFDKTNQAPADKTLAYMNSIQMQAYLPNGTSMYMVHGTPPDYKNYGAVMDGSRVCTSSLLWTNTTPTLTRGGSIVGARIPVEQSWLGYLGTTIPSDPFDYVSVKEGAVSMDASNGAYAYTIPSSPEAFQRWSVEARFPGTGQSGFGDHWHPIVLPYGGEVIIACQSPSTADLQSSIQTFTVAIEYQTSSQWFEKRLATATLSEISAAIAEVARLPAVTENPVHSKLARSIMNGIEDVSEVISSFRGAVSKQSGRLGSIIDAFLG
jgi:hypothetical protein